MKTESNLYDILLDTGASIHIINQKSLFSKLDKSFDSETSFLEMADGSKAANIIEGRGTAKIPIKDTKGENRVITLKDALFVPTFLKNIISISLAIKENIFF